MMKFLIVYEKNSTPGGHGFWRGDAYLYIYYDF